MARPLFLCLLAPLHLIVVSTTVGLRPEHLALDAVFAALLLLGGRAATFATLALPFWGVALAYEAMPLLLPLRGSVHVADLYRAELAIFGIETASGRVTPPAFFAAHLHPALDLICGATYIIYLGEVFGLGAYFYFKDQERMSITAWAFLLVNLLGITTYVLYPAAPPWYVDAHGLGPAVLDAAPSAARAARFDELVGVGVFASFYSRNVNVFGAMPSLHCAYSAMMFLICRRLGATAAVLTAGFALLVQFSAVYLNHHYVLDVIAGVAFGGVSYLAVTAAFASRKEGGFARWFVEAFAIRRSRPAARRC